MADDWKSWSFRQKVIMQMEEIARQSPAANQRNAHEIELQVCALNTLHCQMVYNEEPIKGKS